MDRSIATLRLDLVPATVELLTADGQGRPSLAAMLGADVPDSWPPEHWEPHVLELLSAKLKEDSRAADWPAYYFVRRGSGGEPARLVGNAGFTGPPDEDGAVEIGYSLLPEFQGQGFAHEGCLAMVNRALACDDVRQVVIHTLPELTASIKLAERLGFVFVGPGAEEGTIRYELRKAGRVSRET
jgi:RimJ/RimL family protein N-acetyltransferase